MNKDLSTLIGFLLFLLGFIALSLSLVGLNLKIFSVFELLPSPMPFLLKILLIIAGIVMIYISKVEVKSDTRS